MYRILKVLFMTAVFAGYTSLGAFAAGSHDGMQEHVVPHAAPGPASSASALQSSENGITEHDGMQQNNTIMQDQGSQMNPAGEHEGHTSSHSEPAKNSEGGHSGDRGHTEAAKAPSGPDWPVIYGFGAVNLAVIMAAALSRYIFKVKSEVKTND